MTTSMREWMADNTTAEELERWGPVTVLALVALVDSLTKGDTDG